VEEESIALIALLALALHIASDPARLQLGEGTTAHVTIEVPEGASAPRLSASAGSIGEVVRQADGTWAAQYTPPDETVPQVAIISAVARTERGGPQAAYVAVPLWGQGDAVVKTRPHARIEVSIADQTFGPVKADATGTALVPVVVPPGIAAARHGARDIDLHIPPQRLVDAVEQLLLAVRLLDEINRAGLDSLDGLTGSTGQATAIVSATGGRLQPLTNATDVASAKPPTCGLPVSISF